MKKRTLLNVLLILAMALAVSPAAFAQPGTDRPLPDSYSGLKLSTPQTVSNAAGLLKVDRSLLTGSGLKRVVVRLAEPSVAAVAREGAGRSAQQGQAASVRAQQDSVIQQARGLDGRTEVLGSAQKALNAVMLRASADTIRALAADPAVISIKPVIDYQMDLSETVPYIGASAVQAEGFDGSGIRVAVLDSGVDYTHADLGGSGDPADYAANDPTIIEPGTFPTTKVIGGFDFVGGNWAGGADVEEPDPDPLDDGPGAGHGTHVADIIGGAKGVAPGASIYAVKVCSSVSTACSGVALIQGMDFALDPNGDDDVGDHVDVINMSLGSLYGTAFDDDLSQAVENATGAGVLTVAAAGNGSDKPYVSDTPGAAPSALSVAQTNVPSAVLPLLEVVSPESIAGVYAAEFQPWSVPLTTVIEAPLQYGDGAGGNLDGCAAFDPGSLDGLIVLVDRGACNFTLKISNISVAGGEAGIIGLIAPGDPFAGGDGGDRPIDIPGFMISQADSDTLKSGLDEGVTVRFDPATGIPLIMHMVGGSSRGPSMGTNIIKPEIGAPGASVSAVAGSGTGTGPFGGTSGATPMVAGSAALLMQAYPGRSPLEIKAVLMNTGETDILNEPVFFGGDLAAITRIGGGEVRVDQAYSVTAAAWNTDAPTAALSFGFHDVTESSATLNRRVTVHNYANQSATFDVDVSFRFPDDEASGGVTVTTSKQSVTVPAHGNGNFNVQAVVHTTSLPEWTLNSGSDGNNGDLLTAHEFDGYVTLTEVGNPDNTIHLPWQVLPRAAGDVSVTAGRGDTYKVRNFGWGSTLVETYSLLDTSPDLPEGGPGELSPTPDLRYSGYTTIPVPAGFCGPADSFVMAFAVNTWERLTLSNAPAEIDVFIDVDQDGTFDYNVFTFDLSLSTSLSDGRNVVWVADLATGEASAFFFTDHDTNSGNTVMLICGDQIGMDASNFFDPMDVQYAAFDWYNGGPGDATGVMTISPLGEQFFGVFQSTGGNFSDLPANTTDQLEVLDFGFITNNTETGLLLLYRGGAPASNEAAAIELVP